MNELENKLRSLKLRKAIIYSNIESLSVVDESLFAQFGKNEAEILKVKKQIVRATENNLE